MRCFVLVVSVLVSVGCGSDTGESTSDAGQSPGDQGTPRSARDESPVPAPYADAVNPFAGDAQAAVEGQALYTDNCEYCHGIDARGSEEAAMFFDPPPADLVASAGAHGDDYLRWRIAEGSMETDMPAFSDSLSDDEIWKIVTFVRAVERGEVAPE